MTDVATWLRRLVEASSTEDRDAEHALTAILDEFELSTPNTPGRRLRRLQLLDSEFARKAPQTASARVAQIDLARRIARLRRR